MPDARFVLMAFRHGRARPFHAHRLYLDADSSVLLGLGTCALSAAALFFPFQDGSGADDGSPYKPLVLRVKEFDKTPGRFKRKPDQPAPSKPLSITEAKVQLGARTDMDSIKPYLYKR